MTTEIASSDPKTLFAIADDLSAYIETLAYIEVHLSEAQTDEDRAALAAQHAEIQSSIESIGVQLARKTDAVAAVLRRLKAEQGFVDDERGRLKLKLTALERADKWLRSYVLSVMQQKDLKQLKTATNTLFIRASDAVEITDPGKVPAAYMNAEVKLPLWLWLDIMDAASADTDLSKDIAALRVHSEPSISTIKKAIKSGVDVPGADLRLKANLVCR